MLVPHSASHVAALCVTMGGPEHAQALELDADASDAAEQGARCSDGLQNRNNMTEEATSAVEQSAWGSRHPQSSNHVTALTTSNAQGAVHLLGPDTAVSADKEGSSVRCVVWNCIPLVSEELAGVHLLVK